MAERAGTELGRRHLLVAALVWGTGTKALSVQRRSHIFTKSEPTEIDTQLATGLDLLHKEGAVPAYFAWNNEYRIRHLGPAFFTKVLYFAGYEAPASSFRPLILDSVVSRALKSVQWVGPEWPERGWTTPQYEQYLSIVHDYAHAVGVRPDQIEAALFQQGKRPA
jgi:hypothetical protein